MSGMFGGTGVSNDDTSTSNSSTTTNQQDNRVVAGDGAVVIGQDGQYSVDNSFGLSSTSTNTTSTSNSGNWDWYNANTSSDDNSLNVSSTTNNSGGNWDWNATTSSDSSNSGNWDWNATTTNSSDSSNSGNWDWNATTSTTTNTDSHDTYTLSDSGAMTTAAQMSATNAEFLGLAAETQSETLQFIANMSAEQLAATGDSMAEMFTYGVDQNRQAWESTLSASQGLIGQMLGQAAATTESAKQIANAAISSFMPTDNKNADTARYALYAGLAFLAYKALK